MPFHVGERLLHDPEEIESHGGGQTPAQSRKAGLNFQAGSGLEFRAESAACGRQTELVKVAGTEIVGDAAVFFQRLNEQLVAAGQDRAFAVRDPSGTVCRIAGVATDVTRQKLAEQSLRETHG